MEIKIMVTRKTARLRIQRLVEKEKTDFQVFRKTRAREAQAFNRPYGDPDCYMWGTWTSITHGGSLQDACDCFGVLKPYERLETLQEEDAARQATQKEGKN